MKKNGLMFLFGAGASIEAGVCSSEKITEVLINYGKYCPSKHSVDIENLLKYIQVRIADYLQVRASEVNFEYLLGTLSELSQKEGYAIVPFLGDGDQLVKKLEAKLSLNEVLDKLYSLLREQFFLRKSVKYLHPLQQFIEKSAPLDLFTLNYDLSLETALKELGIGFTTGFKKIKQQSYPIWHPGEFENKGLQARIFKLHGSINWGHYFETPPPKGDADTIEVSDATRYYMYHYPQRIEFSPFPIKPIEPPNRSNGMVGIMNFGTRKELLYTTSQFTVMFHYFLEALQSVKTCVIAGYSFRDEAINKALEEAMIHRKGNLRLVIIDPNWRILDENPTFHEFNNFGWIKIIEKSIGAALQDNNILQEVDDIHNQEPLCNLGDGEKTEEPSKEEQVLKQWNVLGNNFDLTCFWAVCLYEELKEKNELEKFKNCNNETDAIELGRLLMPLNRQVYNLCWNIKWLYDAMELSGTYSEEDLKSIKVQPEVTNNFSFDLIQKWLPRLWEGVNYAFGAYNSVNDFRSIEDKITDFKASCIHEFMAILNDIYKGAGYEEPFAIIAKSFQS